MLENQGEGAFPSKNKEFYSEGGFLLINLSPAILTSIFDIFKQLIRKFKKGY